MDIDYAATVWDRAGTAGEEWLRRRAARFCLVHWGRVVRSEGFRRLSRQSMMELCGVIDVEGRVVGGEELEMVGGLGGGKFGVGGSGREVVKDVPPGMGMGGIMSDATEGDGDEEEGMDVG